MATESEYMQAEARFKLAQKALEHFTQENIRVTLAGSEFISDDNADQLSRRLAALRSEYDEAGREWAEALSKAPVEGMAMNITVAQLVDSLTRKIFRGWLPADAEMIVNAVMQTVPCLQDPRWVEVRQAFRDELLLEIECRLALQESLVIFNQVEFLN